MGGDSTDWTSPGAIISQGGEKAGEDATLDTGGRNMGLPPSRRLPEGGIIGGDGDLHLQIP